MTPPKSLNALVPWTWLLDVLGIAVPGPLLPTDFLRCPLCNHELLSIVEDCVAGGYWFHCRHCDKSGDMIELAAKAWGLSIEASVIKLSQFGLDLPTDSDTIRAYVTSHVEYRKRLRQLWKQAQPHHSATLRALLSRMRLPNEFPPERWDAGPAQILGGEQCRTIEEVLLPDSTMVNDRGDLGRCTSRGRIFRGGGWGEAVLLPFYAAPGQICGFGFIGRHGDMLKDYVYRHANISPFVNQAAREAGLAMHPDARDFALDWNYTAFAVSDPLVYLRLHLQNFEHSNSPLPLVLWHDLPGKPHVRTQDAWQMFGDCRIVFWDQSVNLTTLRQAIDIDGWIATCGPHRNDEENFREYLWRFTTPTALCRHLQKQARPWPTALAKAMPRWSDCEIEDLFIQLNLDAPQIEQIREACPHEFRQRLDAILKSDRIQRFVYYGDHVVLERDDGWYCYRDGAWARHEELLCNATLKLSQIVTHKPIERSLVLGTITADGEEFPFTAPYKEITRNPYDWIQRFLLPKKKSILCGHPRWHKRLFDIANFFHLPTIVQGTDTVGWDQEAAAFRLPARVIGLDGFRKLPLIEDVSALPAAGLRYSSKPLSADWHKLGSRYDLSLCWGVLAAILSNIMAPVLFRETKGLGLVGEGAREMGLAVAKAAGCLVCEIRSVATVRKAATEEYRHHWPLRVPIAANATSMAVRLWMESDHGYARNCVTPLDEEVAEKKRAEGLWHLLIGRETATVSKSLLRVVRRLVPSYLRDVCERRLRVEDVLADLAEFVNRQGGTIDIAEVRKVLSMAGEPSKGRHGERPRRKATVAAMGSATTAAMG